MRPQRQAGLCAAAALVALASLPGAAAAATVRLHVASNPGLFPAFDSGVHDYVSRCGSSGRLRLSFRAPTGTTVGVDGGPLRGGHFAASVELAPGESTVIRSRSSAGELDYHVRCLPSGFPSWGVRRTGPAQAQWYLVAPKRKGFAPGHWAFIFDSHGVPVWWIRAAALPYNLTLLRNGHLAWFPYTDGQFGIDPSGSFEEHRLDGTLVRTLSTVGIPNDAHEFVELPSGNLLLDAYPPRADADLRPLGGPRHARVYDAEIQEVTPSGRLVWSWNSHGHIALTESRHWWGAIKLASAYLPEPPSYDLVHVNSVAKDHHGGALVSMRHTDAIYRIDIATGAVDWKLGGSRTARSLRIVGRRGKASSLFGGQHDVRVLADGTVSVYDNGTGWLRPPRILRFRIDPRARTATLVEERTYRRARLSTWGGGAMRLPGGDWVTAWCDSPFVTEMTAKGRVVLRLSFPHRATYRVFAVPPGRLSAAALRAGMDAMHPRGKR